MPSPLQILLGAVGAPGHLFPLMPLAGALRDAGHHVTVATHRSMRAAVEATGCTWIAAGLTMHDAFEQAAVELGITGRPRDPERVAALAARAFGDLLARSVVDDLAPWFDDHRPDLVIAEVGCPGAALAAQRARIPYAVHAIGRPLDPHDSMGAAIVDRVRALGITLGLDDDPLDLEHTHLDICPPSLQRDVAASGGRNVPLRPTMWNPVTPFTDRRAEPGARPWVYLTLGTAGGDESTLRDAINGLATLDVDVLVAAGVVGVESLRHLERSQRVQVEEFVPAAQLMTRFDLVVHHGGAATALGAAAAGTPQILLPWGADQFDNAAALEAVGAGRTLLAADVTGEQIASAAAFMQSDGPRSAVSTLASEITAMPTPTEIAEQVGDWR